MAEDTPDIMKSSTMDLTPSEALDSLEDPVCAVCLDGQVYDDNEILFCDKCNVAVHQTCYLIDDVPDGDWFCGPCKAGFNPAILECELCCNVGGAYKPTTKLGKWVHSLCYTWVPEIYFSKTKQQYQQAALDMDALDKKRFKLKCTICSSAKGVGIQCGFGRCVASAHPWCVLHKPKGFTKRIIKDEDGGFVWEIFCQAHASAVSGPVKPKSKKSQGYAQSSVENDEEELERVPQPKRRIVENTLSSSSSSCANELSMTHQFTVVRSLGAKSRARDVEDEDDEQGEGDVRPSQARVNPHATATASNPAPSSIATKFPLFTLSEWPGQTEGESMDLCHFWNYVSMAYPEDFSPEWLAHVVSAFTRENCENDPVLCIPCVGSTRQLPQFIGTLDEKLASLPEKDRYSFFDFDRRVQSQTRVRVRTDIVKRSAAQRGSRGDREGGVEVTSDSSTSMTSSFANITVEDQIASFVPENDFFTKTRVSSTVPTITAVEEPVDGAVTVRAVIDGPVRMGCEFRINLSGARSNGSSYAVVSEPSDVAQSIQDTRDLVLSHLISSADFGPSHEGICSQNDQHPQLSKISLQDMHPIATDDLVVLPDRVIIPQSEDDVVTRMIRGDQSVYTSFMDVLHDEIDNLLSQGFQGLSASREAARREWEDIESLYVKQRAWKKIAHALVRGIKDRRPDFNKPVNEAVPASWLIPVGGRPPAPRSSDGLVDTAGSMVPTAEPEDSQEDAVCMVCFDGTSSDGNEILFCDGCNAAVHQACYGVTDVPEGDFFCDRCKEIIQLTSDDDFDNIYDVKNLVKCCLCPQHHGGLKPTTDGRWVHLCCAVWAEHSSLIDLVDMSPVDVSQVPVQIAEPEDINANGSRGSRHRAKADVPANSTKDQLSQLAIPSEIKSPCVYCNLKGGFMMRCCDSQAVDGRSTECVTSFHPLCAWFNGCYIESELLDSSFLGLPKPGVFPSGVDFRFFCDSHVPSSLTQSTREEQLLLRQRYRLNVADLEDVPGKGGKRRRLKKKKIPKSSVGSDRVTSSSQQLDLKADALDPHSCAYCYCALEVVPPLSFDDTSAKPSLSALATAFGRMQSASTHAGGSSEETTEKIMMASDTQKASDGVFSSAISDVEENGTASLSMNVAEIKVTVSESSRIESVDVQEISNSCIGAQDSSTYQITHGSSDKVLGGQLATNESSCIVTGNLEMESSSPSSSLAPGATSASSQVLTCSSCGISIHLSCHTSCYGAWPLQDGKWICDPCAVGEESPKCELCPRRGGGFKPTTTDGWAHVFCAKRAPGSIKILSNGAVSVQLIPKENKKSKCFVCNRQRGPCIPCSRIGCSHYFHPLCGRRSGKVCSKIRRGIIESFCSDCLPEDVVLLPSGEWASFTEFSHARYFIEWARDNSNLLYSRDRLKNKLCRLEMELFSSRFSKALDRAKGRKHVGTGSEFDLTGVFDSDEDLDSDDDYGDSEDGDGRSGPDSLSRPREMIPLKSGRGVRTLVSSTWTSCYGTVQIPEVKLSFAGVEVRKKDAAKASNAKDFVKNTSSILQSNLDVLRQNTLLFNSRAEADGFERQLLPVLMNHCKMNLKFLRADLARCCPQIKFGTMMKKIEEASGHVLLPPKGSWLSKKALAMRSCSAELQPRLFGPLSVDYDSHSPQQMDRDASRRFYSTFFYPLKTECDDVAKALSQIPTQDLFSEIPNDQLAAIAEIPAAIRKWRYITQREASRRGDDETLVAEKKKLYAFVAAAGDSPVRSRAFLSTVDSRVDVTTILARLRSTLPVVADSETKPLDSAVKQGHAGRPKKRGASVAVTVDAEASESRDLDLNRGADRRRKAVPDSSTKVIADATDAELVPPPKRVRLVLSSSSSSTAAKVSKGSSLLIAPSLVQEKPLKKGKREREQEKLDILPAKNVKASSKKKEGQDLVLPTAVDVVPASTLKAPALVVKPAPTPAIEKYQVLPPEAATAYLDEDVIFRAVVQKSSEIGATAATDAGFLNVFTSSKVGSIPSLDYSDWEICEGQALVALERRLQDILNSIDTLEVPIRPSSSNSTVAASSKESKGSNKSFRGGNKKVSKVSAEMRLLADDFVDILPEILDDYSAFVRRVISLRVIKQRLHEHGYRSMAAFTKDFYEMLNNCKVYTEDGAQFNADAHDLGHHFERLKTKSLSPDPSMRRTPDERSVKATLCESGKVSEKGPTRSACMQCHKMHELRGWPREVKIAEPPRTSTTSASLTFNTESRQAWALTILSKDSSSKSFRYPANWNKVEIKKRPAKEIALRRDWADAVAEAENLGWFDRNRPNSTAPTVASARPSSSSEPQWCWLCPTCVSASGPRLIGRTIRVWWAGEAELFQGVVDAFDGVSGCHRVLYDDEEWEFVHLSQEPVVILCDSSTVGREGVRQHNNSSSSKQSK